MTETAHLIVKVSAQGTSQVPRELDKVAASASKAEAATFSLTKVWIAAAAAAAALAVGGRKVFEVGKQFESLNAQLKTATGSAENAAIAFEAIQRFAAQTPYDLAQTTDAFIKLTNLGLTPSERALRAYGDTASAMGKTLEEAVNAVARAVAGEFEPLKSFGVQARKEGELLRFTFRGVTTEVDNTAEAIENYFQRLAEDNFTGAMAERMATLEGKASNLADAWDVLFAEISKAGVGDLIKRGIDGAIVAITELTAMISSGQLVTYVEAIIFKFQALGDGVRNVAESATEWLSTAFAYWRNDGKETADSIINSILSIPETLRALAEIVGAVAATIYTYFDAAFTAIYKSADATVNLLVELFTNAYLKIQSLAPGNEAFDFGQAQLDSLEKYSDTLANSVAESINTVKGANDALSKSFWDAVDGREKAISDFENLWDKANKLREQFDLIGQTKKVVQGAFDFFTGGRGDALGGFSQRGTSVSPEYTNLLESLQTQEQALVSHYEKRKALIIKSTADESSERQRALELLDADFASERTKLLDRNKYDFDERITSIEGQTQIELEIRNAAYQQELVALQNANEAKLITQEEYYSRKEELERGHAKITADIVKKSLTQVQTQQLNAYATVLGMAGDISQQIQQVTQEGTTASKVAFAAAKAIAIAQAIVYTELAAIRALAEGGSIAGIPLSTAIRALGYTSVALMTATSIAEISQHEHGGMIPSGRMGIVGEAGAELIQGPAVVTSARTTAGLMQGQRGGGDVFVNVVNNAGNQFVAEVEERETERGKEITVMFREIEQRLASSIRRGGSEIGRSIEETFGIGRGRVAT